MRQSSEQTLVEGSDGDGRGLERLKRLVCGRVEGKDLDERAKVTVSQGRGGEGCTGERGGMGETHLSCGAVVAGLAKELE